MPDDSLIDKAKIVNWALADLGLAPTFSIGDETSQGAQVDIFWPRAIGECFGVHDWPFCRRTYQLVRHAARPDTGYAYRFELPRPRLGEPMKNLADPRSAEPLRSFRIEGNWLHADEPAVWSVVKVPVDPSAWDLQWASAFATALASMLAVPLLQAADLAADKDREAFGQPTEGRTGGKFGRLIAQHRAAEPLGQNMSNRDPLTAGRTSGPWHGRF